MQNHDTVDLKSLADERLVSLAQAGSNQAFEVLMERHYRTCHKLACSILRDRQDAEDEVQNACWKAYEHIGKFQQDSRFSTWLTRIVVNQCLMRLRQIRRSRLVYLEDTVAEDSRPVDLAEPSASPEQVLAKTEVAEVLEHEIRRIPPLLRKVFLLRDVQQLPMEDVAHALGISVAAAKSRLLRARQELRGRLEKHQGRLGAATLLA
ncbi:MAG TPA: sigma-70 family RNA polymerase sigma factor [Bryobacteraceae bacterium]|nr:sigma-70 family RNA polymerase sigma factor [Bryobacteraceae bacterium]